MSGAKKENILNQTAKLGQTNSSSKRKQRQERKKEEGEKMEVPSTYWSIMSYISYIFLVMVGYFREMIWGIGPIGKALLATLGFQGIIDDNSHLSFNL